jgi:hypothetical protein
MSSSAVSSVLPERNSIQTTSALISPPMRRNILVKEYNGPNSNFLQQIQILQQHDIRLVVWDFDCTVLKIHASHLRLKPIDIPSRSIEDDFAQPDFFKSLVISLDQAQIPVAIASFGKYAVIKAYLDMIFSDSENGVSKEFFGERNIITPNKVGGRDGATLVQGKAVQLQLLCELYHVKPSQVLFFDDDPRNISQALSVGYVHSLHTPDAFSDAVWASKIRILQQSPPSPSSSSTQIVARSFAEPPRTTNNKTGKTSREHDVQSISKKRSFSTPNPGVAKMRADAFSLTGSYEPLPPRPPPRSKSSEEENPE